MIPGRVPGMVLFCGLVLLIGVVLRPVVGRAASVSVLLLVPVLLSDVYGGWPVFASAERPGSGPAPSAVRLSPSGIPTLIIVSSARSSTALATSQVSVSEGGPGGHGTVVRPPAAVPVVAREPVRPATGYRWPLDGTPPVLRRFDPPAEPWLSGHRGLDLGGAPGDPVRSAGPGTVVYRGVIAGRGVISVRHPNGLRTTYEPVDALAELQIGGPVAAGEPIGVLAAGHPECSAAACLHWGLRRGDQYLDPLALLGLGRVRLLPIL